MFYLFFLTSFFFFALLYFPFRLHVFFTQLMLVRLAMIFLLGIRFVLLRYVGSAKRKEAIEIDGWMRTYMCMLTPEGEGEEDEGEEEEEEEEEGGGGRGRELFQLSDPGPSHG